MNRQAITEDILRRLAIIVARHLHETGHYEDQGDAEKLIDFLDDDGPRNEHREGFDGWIKERKAE